MFIRICLIVAILAGLGAGTLNFVKVKEKLIALQTDLATEKAARAAAEKERDATKKELDKTVTELKQTKATLETTSQERDTAVAAAKKAVAEAEKLTTDLAKTKEERDGALSELQAYKLTGMTPPQIVGVTKQIKKLEDTITATEGENKILAQKLKKTENELAVYKTREYEVPLPAALLGKVLVSDPKWNFVVLNVGEDQGVLQYGELLVNRKGKLVAKIRVSSVQKDRCVANVLPGWQLGDIIEGDQVIPAHPAS